MASKSGSILNDLVENTYVDFEKRRGYNKIDETLE